MAARRNIIGGTCRYGHTLTEDGIHAARMRTRDGAGWRISNRCLLCLKEYAYRYDMTHPGRRHRHRRGA